jgi:WD40 repeat protein
MTQTQAQTQAPASQPSTPSAAHPPAPPAPPSMTLALAADLTGPYGTHLTFSPDGQRWALADSRTIQLGRGLVLEGKLASAEAIRDLAWSPDGAELLASPRRYDLAADTWRPRPDLAAALRAGLAEPPPDEQLGVAAAAWSPDGQELLIAARFQPTRELGGEDHYTGARERLLLLAADGAPRAALYAGDFELRALAISERFIAAGGATVTVWDRRTLQKVAELAHRFTARALAFDARGDRLAVMVAGGDIALWEPSSGQHLGSFSAHAMDGYTLAFHPTQPVLATGGQDGKLRLWSIAAPSLGASLHEEFLGGWVHAVAFDPTGARLGAVTRSMPPHLRLYDVAP